jgi:L-alanine-DL-glutamate epimerase-like enolase superfamily enzyme
MQRLADRPLASSSSSSASVLQGRRRRAGADRNLDHRPAKGGGGWSEVKPCLLLRVITQGGTEGWGEAFVLPCREKAVAEIIHALGQAAASLQSASPWAFRAMALEIASKHRGLDFSAATSALEMALWDIHAKLAEKPLCDLLGGDHRTPLPIYANIWSDTQWDVGSLAIRASDLVAQGYTAVKIHPMLNHSAPQAVDVVRHVRDAIGDEIHLMVDMDSQDDLETSLFVAERIEKYRPTGLKSLSTVKTSRPCQGCARPRECGS